jgi:hypothetical protein
MKRNSFLLSVLLLLGMTGAATAGDPFIITASHFTEGQSSVTLPNGIGTATSSPRPFVLKYLSPDYSLGVGVQGGYVNNEIDALDSEKITIVFNKPTLILDLSIGFLFPPNAGYGDSIPESAKVVATSGGQVIERYLTAGNCSVSTQCEPGTAPTPCSDVKPTFEIISSLDGPSYLPITVGGPCWTQINCTASWTGPGTVFGIAKSSSPAVLPYSGIWDVNNPFGALPVDKLEFTANFFSFGPSSLGNSDFSLMAISLIDPPADPVQISGPGSIQIAIDKAKLGADCSSDLVDFPLLVEIANDPRLRHTSHGGAVENINGYDIIFKDAFNPLAHEVEYYDGSTGSLIAWVKIPALSASNDTVITMAYGDPGITMPTENPEAVWDSHYKAVYHLNQRPKSDGKIYDSTLNALDLTPQKGNSDSNLVPAAVGYGLRFQGWDYLISSKNLTLSSGGKFTYETWVKSSSYWGGRQAMVSIQDGNTHRSRTLTSDDSPVGIGVQHHYDGTSPTYRIANKQPNNAWVHLVARYDGIKLEGFVNGVKTQSASYPVWGPVAGLVTLGVWRGETGWLNWFLTEGTMDEVRISDDARDSCRIETSYSNQHAPSSFYKIQ